MVRPVAAKHPVTLGYRAKAKFDPSYIHRGIDYGCPSGTPVVATTAGKVVAAGTSGGYGPAYGIQVVIKTGNAWHLYAHLSAEQVSIGQEVQAGQQIGKSGATGKTRGAHLHYQECTEPPAAYKSDRRPVFVDAPADPVDKMNPASYYVGARGDHVLWLGQRLVAHGPKSYTPTRDFTKADVKAIAAFQRKQGWSGAAADGLPGKETLKRLAAAPPKPSTALPADVVDLRRAKLTTPFGKEDHPTEVKQPGLNRYADSRCFFVRTDSAGKRWVVFRVKGDGVTTSGSDYPRCELREMELDGDKAEWDTRRDHRLLEATYRVAGNAKVVVAQIHDAGDDLVMVSWQAGRIVVEWSKGKGKGSTKEQVGTVKAGEEFTITIEAKAGEVVVKLNGKKVDSRKKAKAGCYQKAGAYLQSDNDSAWAEVAIEEDTLKMGEAA